MLEEYKGAIPKLRSDILGTERVIGLLGVVSEKRILDLGCGNGKVARQLAQAGAKVTGVELVPEQLQEALDKEATEPFGIRYLSGNIAQPLPVGEFDIALMLMVSLYLNPTELLESFWHAHSYLREGGRLIYLNIHPFRAANYFQTIQRSETLPTLGGGTFSTTFYHHPLEWVMNGIAEAGFRVMKILEPQPTAEERVSHSEFLAGSDKRPTYLIIEAIKQPPP